MSKSSIYNALPGDIEDHVDLLARQMSRAIDQLEALVAHRGNPDPAAESDHRVIDKLAVVRGYLQARRLRERLLPTELFGEPAWDILLDLYAAGLEGKAVSVSSACIASAVPTTTALRWLGKLTECGLIQRTGDRTDGRRANVQLTVLGNRAINRWVRAMFRQMQKVKLTSELPLTPD